MELLPKLPPKSSGAHQFFSYMIYHVNHVFVFTVVVLIILKYITPQNGLCQILSFLEGGWFLSPQKLLPS